jgi:hypothetical protein
MSAASLCDYLVVHYEAQLSYIWVTETHIFVEAIDVQEDCAGRIIWE